MSVGQPTFSLFFLLRLILLACALWAADALSSQAELTMRRRSPIWIWEYDAGLSAKISSTVNCTPYDASDLPCDRCAPMVAKNESQVIFSMQSMFRVTLSCCEAQSHTSPVSGCEAKVKPSPVNGAL